MGERDGIVVFERFCLYECVGGGDVFLRPWSSIRRRIALQIRALQPLVDGFLVTCSSKEVVIDC